MNKTMTCGRKQERQKWANMIKSACVAVTLQIRFVSSVAFVSLALH